MKKELGGDRIGSGGKMKVELKEFPYSTHDLSHRRMITAPPGAVIPLFNFVTLPDDRWHIKTALDILTNPAVGPNFSSFIADIHIYESPTRLYIGDLHQNMLEIGNDMSLVKLPQIELSAYRATDTELKSITQIEPSTLFAHLDIMGIGKPSSPAVSFFTRQFNALPVFMYYDIIKCYYANKQEDNAYIIHTPVPTINQTVTGVQLYEYPGATPQAIAAWPAISPKYIGANGIIVFTYAGTQPDPAGLTLTFNGQRLSANSVFGGAPYQITGTTIEYRDPVYPYAYSDVQNWGYSSSTNPAQGQPKLTAFPLKNIDQLRINLLKATGSGTAYVINNAHTALAPYTTIIERNATDLRTSIQYPLEGLAVKTYQSDVNNNWLKTAWVNSVNSRSSINVSGGTLTMDALNTAKKVYELLNTIALAGGTFDDWIETVWSTEKIQRSENPIYHGGLRKELAFQEVIATTASQTDTIKQPLGQLGGRGQLTRTHKGGEVSFHVKEPGTTMALFSLTPRIEYCQGNKWDTNLKTMDDLHKPQMDGIGFQDGIMDTLLALSTVVGVSSGVLTFKSFGKQPAWINYMTMTNQVRGNFAIPDNQMFMTMARRYEFDGTTGIKDMTTYIDPAKYNYIFAETDISAQNFQVFAGFQITVRRKMSAKIIPNF